MLENRSRRLRAVLRNALTWGLAWGVAGGALVAGVGQFDPSLADISPVKFGLLGAVVGGVGVPLFLQTMNVLSGDGPIAWGLVGDDAVWATLFGGVAAAGSILLARRAERLPLGPRAEELDRAEALDALPAAGPLESPLVQRERVAQR